MTRSRATAAPMMLHLHGHTYFYAFLVYDPPSDENPAFRCGERHPLYSDRDEMLADLAREEIPVDAELSEPVDVDLARQLIGATMSESEISTVINAWNALDDLTKVLGTPLRFYGELACRAYDKLFWGLNLESVTPVGQSFTPTWRPRELAKIDQVLRECGARIDPAAKKRGG